MKVSKFMSLGLAACWLASLAVSAALADDPSADDVTRRTERALFKMSQLDAGNKKVRVLTPAKQVSAVEDDAPAAPPVDPPAEMTGSDVGGPMPEEDAISTENNPTALEEVGGEYSGEYSEGCGGECGDDCGCEDCCDLCCDCLCGPPGHCWVRADVLGWWTSGMKVPALVTTGPDNDNPGVIGERGTHILFGDDKINDRARIGGKLTVGTWLDACHSWGLEGDYFGIDDDHNSFFATSLDYPFLSRPIIDVTNGLPGDPGVEAIGNEDLCGQVRVDSKTGFQGAGGVLRHKLFCNVGCDGGSNPLNDNDWSANCCRVDFIGGYRFYRLDDSLSVREQLMVIADGGQIAQGTTFDITDSFRTRNEFHGGEFGLVGTMYRGAWSLELLAKVALGNNHSKVRINGSTTTTVPGQDPNTLEGGLLALDSNIGDYTRDDFVAIPQFGAQLGYQWNKHLRGFVGYNFLVWSQVARAGDQIDLRVDTNQLPPGTTGTFPEFRYADSSFWAQGINGGLEVRW